ncbi:lipase family alpha/beta hydrolase [Amycolatopsis sp. cg5]|uniref:lipase family alpha/beta hydrolase n=1 Tax=Amycolatopsis sp. cg5 TaxID=3238802 RepID=UPI0035260B0B
MTVPLIAGDGLPLKLDRVVAGKPPVRGPVLLVHGAGNRGATFRPPHRTTLVDALLAEGWDVWLFDWRASKEVGFVDWTLDQAAEFDHPAAVAKVLELTGADDVKIIAHCVGSASVAMSAAAGRLDGVSTIIGNAFALHPVVPPLSTAKLRGLVPIVGALTREVSPAWGDKPAGLLAHVIRHVVRMTHRECRNDVCRMASFIFGGGRSSLWNHENLDEATHDWLRAEFGPVPMSFFRQMAGATANGHFGEVYTGAPGARFVLLTGADNRCFLPESQRRTFAHLERHQPGRHELHVFPGYGHLDVFIGKNAHADTFPTILAELEK